MSSDLAQPFLAAPIVNSEKFALFTAGQNSRDRWELRATVADAIPSEFADKLVEYPVLDISEWVPSSQTNYPGHVADSKKYPAYMKNLTIINSKGAGSQNGGDLYFNILSPLLKAFGIYHIYVATVSATTISEHAASFSSSATVVIMGGDTSVHEFVNALAPSAGTEMRLCVVPAGTGNALCSSMGAAQPLTAIQRLILGHEFRPLSTFQVSFPEGSVSLGPLPLASLSLRALVVASWGLHSAIVADSDSPEMRKHGRDRFKLAAEENINQVDQVYKGKVLGVTDPVPDPFSYLLFTTVSHLEPTFCISPRSQPPSSGKIFSISIPHLPGQQLMDIMYEVYDNSRHVDDSRVIYQQLGPSGCQVVVEDQPTRMRRWCIDGRIVDVAPGTVGVGPASTEYNGWALRII